jgi:hypothetical protein
MQIQGNQYQSWMNGVPFEAGMFQIQGNMMFGQNQMGCPSPITSSSAREGSPSPSPTPRRE